MKLDKSKIKNLSHWLTASEAAERLRVTGTRVHELVDNGGFELKDLRYVGNKSRKILLIHERGVEKRLIKVASLRP